VAGKREVAIMKTILLAGAAAIVLGAGATWVGRPTLPGDQFQLAEGKLTRVAEGSGTQTRVAEGNGSQTRMA
jgi:hypothetical protein